MGEQMYNVVLLDDDVNQLYEVVKILSTVLNYPTTQSEQLATLVHHKGEVEVKVNIPESHADNYVQVFTELGLNVKKIKNN